jgi:hypothetical protein
MRETIEVKIKMNTKDVNQVLAILGQSVITTDEEAAEYDGNTLDATDFPNSEMEAKVGLGGIFLAAKASKEEENQEKDEDSET